MSEATNSPSTESATTTTSTDTACQEASPAASASETGASKKVVKKGSGNDSIAGTLVICLFLIVMVMGYFLHDRIQALERERATTPTIMVIDYQGLFAGLPEDVTAEEAEHTMVQVNERILSFQDAGYIVLDEKAVLAVPNHLRIPADVLLNDGGVE